MTKTQTHKILPLLLTILFVSIVSIFTSIQAKAEGAKRVFETQIHIGSDGLAIQQPTISQTEILKTLTQAHHLLSKKGLDAEKIITENNASANMAIAAIMPGGLIYLAYKQSKLSGAKATLTKIKSELTNLDEDAVTLYRPVYKPNNQAIIVARYP